MALLRTVAGVVGASVAFFLLLVLGKFAGPDLEGKIYPVISATLVSGSVHRVDGVALCWTLHMEKYRDDAPAYFNYRIIFTRQFIAADGSTRTVTDRVPVAAYRVNEKKERIFLSTYGFANHNANQTWDTTHCADLPKELNIENIPFKLEGEAFYDTPHHLWLVSHKLPSFEVPPD